MLVTVLIAGLLVSAGAAGMTRGERSEHERQISADFKVEKARCDFLGGPEKAGCLDRAKANNRVAQAELAYNASGSQADAGRLAVAQSDADYAFARDRCEARRPADRETCIRVARAAHARAAATGH